MWGSSLLAINMDLDIHIYMNTHTHTCIHMQKSYHVSLSQCTQGLVWILSNKTQFLVLKNLMASTPQWHSVKITVNKHFQI